MADVPLIGVGASLGGLNAVAAVLKDLSPDFPAAILAVIHIGEQNAQLPRYFKEASEQAAARFEQIEQSLKTEWTRPELVITSAGRDATARDK